MAGSRQNKHSHPLSNIIKSESWADFNSIPLMSGLGAAQLLSVYMCVCELQGYLAQLFSRALC